MVTLISVRILFSASRTPLLSRSPTRIRILRFRIFQGFDMTLRLLLEIKGKSQAVSVLIQRKLPVSHRVEGQRGKLTSRLPGCCQRGGPRPQGRPSSAKTGCSESLCGDLCSATGFSSADSGLANPRGMKLKCESD